MRTCLLVHSEWLLTPERVAIHLPTATAVVADLHLGYDVTRLNGGDAIPNVSLEEELDPLRRVLVEHAVHRIVVAGDLVESAHGQSLVSAFQNCLTKSGVEWATLVRGNHDRGILIGGLPCAGRDLALGKWTVVHGDNELPAAPVVQGHLHPFFRWTNHVAGPCYLVSADRLILPAYSAESAGVNVLCDRRWKNYRCYVIAGAGVLDLGRLRDLPGRRGNRPGERHTMRRPPGRRSRRTLGGYQ